jgi:hypothetical protein
MMQYKQMYYIKPLIYYMYIKSVDTTALFIITTCFGPYWTIFR